MTGPTPTPGSPTSQFIDEAYQHYIGQNQNHNHNHNINPPTTTTTNEIESEAAFNAQFNAPPHQLVPPSDYNVQTGVGPSNNSSSSAQRLHGQQSAHVRGGSGVGSGIGNGGRDALETTQKSLQARGRNPHANPAVGRAWEERQRRDEAVGILESEEMVMWIAGVRNESIPQTRAHYRNIVLGLEQPPATWNDEWEVQGGSASAEGQQGLAGSGSPARSGKGKEKDIAKMRKRVSSGQGPA